MNDAPFKKDRSRIQSLAGPNENKLQSVQHISPLHIAEFKGETWKIQLDASNIAAVDRMLSTLGYFRDSRSIFSFLVYFQTFLINEHVFKTAVLVL